VAGDDQRHRISGHGLTDIAGGFRPGAEFHRQSAIGRRVAPSDMPRRGIDALEEWVLLAEVEPEAGKIRLLALKIALHGGDTLSTFSAQFGLRQPIFQVVCADGQEQPPVKSPTLVNPAIRSCRDISKFRLVSASGSRRGRGTVRRCATWVCAHAPSAQSGSIGTGSKSKKPRSARARSMHVHGGDRCESL
jgi:hypothetical protein